MAKNLLFTSDFDFRRSLLLQRPAGTGNSKICRGPLCEDEKEELIKKVCNALKLKQDDGECGVEIDEVRFMHRGEYLDNVNPTCATPEREAAKAECGKQLDDLVATATATKDECTAAMNQTLTVPSAFDGSRCPAASSLSTESAREAITQCELPLHLMLADDAKPCEKTLGMMKNMTAETDSLCQKAVEDMELLVRLQARDEADFEICDSKHPFEMNMEDIVPTAGKEGALHPSCQRLVGNRMALHAQYTDAVVSNQECRAKYTDLDEVATYAKASCATGFARAKGMHGCYQEYDAAMVLFSPDSEMAQQGAANGVDYCDDLRPNLESTQWLDCVQGTSLPNDRFLEDSKRLFASNSECWLATFATVLLTVFGAICARRILRR